MKWYYSREYNDELDISYIVNKMFYRFTLKLSNADKRNICVCICMQVFFVAFNTKNSVTYNFKSITIYSKIVEQIHDFQHKKCAIV